MHIQAERGDVRVVLRRRLAAVDAERIQAAVLALGPVSCLTMELCHPELSGEAELALIAEIVTALPPGKSTIRGLTMDQSQVLLRCLSEAPGRAVA